MKMNKTLLLVTTILLVPVTSAFPVMQDMQPVMENLGLSLAGGQNGVFSGSLPIPSSLSPMPDAGIPGATETVIDFLTSTNSPSTMDGALSKELETQLQDELVAPAQTPFWRRKSVLLFGAFIILGGLLSGLFAGGSGSGSGGSGTPPPGGSGSGGSGGGGDIFGSDGGNGLGDIFGFLSLNDGGDGDTNRTSDTSSSPEPSSMLLLSLGLAALYVRKRRLAS